MESAQRMGEARVFCALIGIESQSQLLNPSQSLKLLRVDQTHHQLAFATVSAKANYVVDRIAIDSFGQNSYLGSEDSLAQRKFAGSSAAVPFRKVRIVAGPGEFQTALFAPDQTIMRFVNNPLVPTQNTLKIDMLVKARPTMEAIILLTSELKKPAARLSKISPGW